MFEGVAAGLWRRRFASSRPKHSKAATTHAHLEPDRMHKHQYLEATLRAKSGQTRLSDFPHFGMDRYTKPTSEQVHSANEGHLRQVEELSAEIDRLATELVEKNELAVRVGTEVRDMYQSISWRLTAPVRSVLSKFGVN